MPKYLFVYHGGGAPETPEEGEKVMAAWMAWFSSLGDAVVNPGEPVGMSSTLSAAGLAEGGGANPVSGFSILQAESLEAVAEMGKGCPILDHEGATIEIAPVMEM